MKDTNAYIVYDNNPKEKGDINLNKRKSNKTNKLIKRNIKIKTNAAKKRPIKKNNKSTIINQQSKEKVGQQVKSVKNR